MTTPKEAVLDDTQANLMRRIALSLGDLLNRVQPSGELVALGTSLLVGLGTGLSAVVFNLLIQHITRFSFGTIPSILGTDGFRWYIIAVPAVGGLIVGPLIYFFAREAKGHGVPEVMQAIALNGGRIRPIVAVVKAVASSITIGTGGSVGREGPIVQIGAALGSSLGQLLHLSDERIRNLVACGAAGGIAATFNAPIAGVIFALEVILGELTISHVGTVVISAVTASAVMRAILGGEFAFPVPQPYTIQSGWEFIFYAVFGVIAAFVAVSFVKSLYWTEDFFDSMKKVPGWVQPAIGGLLLGVIALAYPLVLPSLNYDTIPQVFGGGYGPISDALAGSELMLAAAVFLVLKLIATDLTLGSGGSGGVFAPALFMGAMTGVIFGQLVNMLFPGIPAPPGAYALVGMGAVFAGSAHAPITAVVMLFELTGDYRIILPLMLTIVIAMLVARKMLGNDSIYTLKLTRRGIRLQRGRDIDVMQSVQVGDVMTQEVFTVPETMTLVELSEEFSQARHHGFAIMTDTGKLWGIVTITDLERAVNNEMPRRTPVTKIGTPYSSLLLAYPDEPMGAALRRMGTRGLGHLPVVSREKPRELLGMLRREDAIRAYHVAVTRRAELEHRQKRMQLRNIDGTEFTEIRLGQNDAIVGKKLQEIATAMPDDCVLISIRRDDRVVIPHGDTIFQPDDLITAFIKSDEVELLQHCMHGVDGTKAEELAG